jgi:hypothetical protein
MEKSGYFEDFSLQFSRKNGEGSELIAAGRKMLVTAGIEVNLFATD